MPPEQREVNPTCSKEDLYPVLPSQHLASLPPSHLPTSLCGSMLKKTPLLSHWKFLFPPGGPEITSNDRIPKKSPILLKLALKTHLSPTPFALMRNKTVCNVNSFTAPNASEQRGGGGGRVKRNCLILRKVKSHRIYYPVASIVNISTTVIPDFLMDPVSWRSAFRSQLILSAINPSLETLPSAAHLGFHPKELNLYL